MIKVMRNLEKATFSGGCFWCMEAIFKNLKGVKSVVSGYSGGSKPDPTYQQVCSGKTGHAEAIQITFDPKEIAYAKLLEAFWKAHDPTTLNRQGGDVGEQYRSVIFYHDERQKSMALKSMAYAQKNLDKPIVTQIVPLEEFYPAEDYHQDYYNKNKKAPYCQLVISPKLRKLGIE